MSLSRNRLVGYQPQIIVPFGVPTAGKEEFSNRVSDLMVERGIQVERVGVGDIVRTLIKTNEEVASYCRKGLLVPEELIMPHVSDRIKSVPRAKVLFIDGLPRSVKQLPMYEKMRDESGRKDLVLSLKLGKDEKEMRDIATRRMLKRGRPDDLDPKTRETRFEEAAKLDPVLDHFKSQEKVYEIDADQPLDVLQNVYAQLVEDLFIGRLQEVAA